MKRLLSFILAAAIICGMSFSASAIVLNPPSSYTGPIGGVVSGLPPGGAGGPAASASGRITDMTMPIDSNGGPDLSSVSPGGTYTYALTADMFNWSDGGQYTNGTPVSRAQLSAAGAAVKVYSRNSGLVKSTSIGTTTFNGMSTACVKVEFASNHVSISSQDFDITLIITMNGRAQGASQIRMIGTIQNQNSSVDSDDNYVDGSDGKVIEASEYVRDVDFYLGRGVIITLNMYPDRKYYGVATSAINDMSNSFLDSFDGLVDVIRLKTVNLNARGTPVRFEDYDGCYVYDTAGRYLGTTANTFAYLDTYVITDSRNRSDVVVSGGGTANPVAQQPAPKATAGEPILSGTATSVANQVVRNAGSGGTAVADFKNAASISPAAIKAMASVGRSAGVNITLRNSTTAGDATIGRLSLNTSHAANAQSDIKLGVYTDSRVNPVVKKFNGWFVNRVAVVELAHSGNFGMNVNVAAYVNLNGFDTKNLCFYTYNPSNNGYKLIQGTSYSVSNGFLNFSTAVGGYIVVSNGPLQRR